MSKTTRMRKLGSVQWDWGFIFNVAASDSGRLSAHQLKLWGNWWERYAAAKARWRGVDVQNSGSGSGS